MSDRKIALVTGANKGIGLETARQLAALGMTVLLGSRDAARGEAAAAPLRAAGLDVRPVKLDVTSAADRAAVAAHIAQEFGRLDVLVNNAGVSLEGADWTNRTSTTTEEALRGTFETNLFAVVALTQVLLPLLRKSSAGRIVNLSSVLASNTLHAAPGSAIANAKAFAYSASKAALNTFTIHLAHELKDTRIKVNSAHPGWVKTEMGGAGAPMEVKQGAETSVTLATLPDDGPTGGYFHLGKPLPW
ncbi:MAG: SDR family oxidoreductase [Acidobacteriota bacterium]|nr:SDR family oxidoreductase [Acidobacteriota bacterium]